MLPALRAEKDQEGRNALVLLTVILCGGLFPDSRIVAEDGEQAMSFDRILGESAQDIVGAAIQQDRPAQRRQIQAFGLQVTLWWR